MTAGERYEYVEVEDVIRSTDKALLVKIDGDEYWLPKSQVLNADEVDPGVFGTQELEISRWWLKEQGLL